MDDSDVKIFKKEKRDDKFDEIGLISKMNEERGNGNIDKSKRLGSYLASIFLDKDGKGKDNEEYASLGSELWSGVLEEVEEIIRRYEFVGMKK